MKVSNPIPCKEIAAYVERILVIEHYHISKPFTLPLFANGVPTLLYTSVRGLMGNCTTGNLTLFGQTVCPQSITFSEGFTLIAYFFKPFALGSVFGIAAPELTDKPTDLYLTAPQRATELTDRLLHVHSADHMIALLNDYILALIANAAHESSVAKYAAAEIAAAPFKESLLRVRKELHMTERTFQRMFENNIGVAPNTYRRICQFNTSFQQLNTRRFHKLSDIAFSHGYADQSHYIRAFKEFTNLTPKDYLNFGE